MDQEYQIERSTDAQEDSPGRFFRYMAEFVGFTQEDANAIRESGLVIEKHLPAIIARFYDNLLQFPTTRKLFTRRDGSIDQEYLQLRMMHQANFWRRTASGSYDGDYARYIDYVGRAHTSRGADPKIYVEERYVIGMIGFVQHAITEALALELGDFNPDLELRAVKAWNKLAMLLLEMLARAYGKDRDPETPQSNFEVDSQEILQLSIDSYEHGLGIRRVLGEEQVFVAFAEEIPEGERKIVKVRGVSIGAFHHKGGWYALRNHCLHRGGPVAAGVLDGDSLICPWHGFTYDVTDGHLLKDPGVHLETYPVSIREGSVYISVPRLETSFPVRQEQTANEVSNEAELGPNEMRISDLPPDAAGLVQIAGVPVAVFNLAGKFYATQNACTHADGPLNEGKLEEQMIICPWHGSCFDVTDGSVLCGPAHQALHTYQVEVHGDLLRITEKLES